MKKGPSNESPAQPLRVFGGDRLVAVWYGQSMTYSDEQLLQAPIFDALRREWWKAIHNGHSIERIEVNKGVMAQIRRGSADLTAHPEMKLTYRGVDFIEVPDGPDIHFVTKPLPASTD